MVQSKSLRPAMLDDTCTPKSVPSKFGPDSRLIVSVDLGTTFSGVAYCLLAEDGEENEIKFMDSWPGLETGYWTYQRHQRRLPTKLYYDAFGSVVGWGFDTANALNEAKYPKDDILECELFNMHLLREDDDNSLDIKSLPLLPQGKDGVGLVADYLSHLFTAIRSILQSEFQSTYDQLESHIEWCFTIPARAGNGFATAYQRAIAQAGSVKDGDKSCSTFINGLEACLFSVSHTRLLAPRLHDATLVVNCGGAMVDLTAFQTVNEQRLEFRKLTHTSGNCCG
jgi:hypothetical protein